MGKKHASRKSVENENDVAHSRNANGEYDCATEEAEEFVSNDSSTFEDEISEKRENCLVEVNNNIDEADRNVISTKQKKLSNKIKAALLLEPDTLKPFCKYVDVLIKKYNKVVDIDGDDDEIDLLGLYTKKELNRLCKEAAKLHEIGAINFVPQNKLVPLLNIVDKILRFGKHLVNDRIQDNRYVLVDGSDPIFKTMDACLIALYVWTSSQIDKTIIMDDGVESVTAFIKFVLQKVIYPAFDRNYQANSSGGFPEVSSKRKKVAEEKNKKVDDKKTLKLYNSLKDGILLLEAFVMQQTLTDSHVLTIDWICISAFSVDNTESLQLALLKLVECVFSKYKTHRKALLDDVLALMQSSSAGNRRSRTFRLQTGEKIQMYSALLMKIIQSTVHFPPNLLQQDQVIQLKEIVDEKMADARKAAMYFLSSFFTKCCSKASGEYRSSLFTLVHDLLVAVDRPEWPAAEVMLHMLMLILVRSSTTNEQEKILVLELSTNVYSELKKKSARHEENMHKIDQLIHIMKQTEVEQSGMVQHSHQSEKVNYSDDIKDQLLQKALLDYIADRISTEPGIIYAKHFHLSYWYTESLVEQKENKSVPEKDNCGEIRSNNKKNRKTSKGRSTGRKSKLEFILDSFHEHGSSPNMLNCDQTSRTFVDIDVAQLIVYHFASMRPLHLNFNLYVNLILQSLAVKSNQIRLKAMRCLLQLIEVDPDIFSLNVVESGIKLSIYDSLIAIRECAIDIVSKIVLSKPDMFDSYINILSERILDTGVSVRKKVIKILGDVCNKLPNSQRSAEIATKILKRINDESGVQNMVLDFFYKLWLMPIDLESTPDFPSWRITSILDVIMLSMPNGLESFELLLSSFLNPKDDVLHKRGFKKGSAKEIVLVSEQLIHGLFKTLFDLSTEESASPKVLSIMVVVFCFAKIKPSLVVMHVDALQSLLDVKCQTFDSQLIIYVLRTLQLLMPLIKLPNEKLISGLEANFEKIIANQEPSVIQNCIACLQSLTDVTGNFKFVAMWMKKCYDFILKYRSDFERRKSIENTGCDSKTNENHQLKCTSKRALFIVGLLMRYFNFCDKNVCTDQVPITITSDVVNLLDFFLRVEDEELQLHATIAIGNVCVRFCKLMMGPGLKGLYCKFLKDDSVKDNLKIQVLHNLKIFLENDHLRKMTQHSNSKKRSKKDSIKVMEDVASGLSGTIIQIYLVDILELTVHEKSVVRQEAQHLTQIILEMGIVNPMQLIPHLIVVTTEDKHPLRNSAEKHLKDIELKYPGFIHMKAQSGLEMSFQLQKVLQSGSSSIRGYRENANGVREAALNFLYTTLNTKQHKRAFISSMVKRFEDQMNNGSMMTYLIDNLAYFQYEVIDELLFTIQNVDVFLSVNGTSILQTFQECLLPDEGSDKNDTTHVLNAEMEEAVGKREEVTEEEIEEEHLKEEDETELLKRLPENIQPLINCLKSSQGCLLLLVLKQYLKAAFNITDWCPTIHNYDRRGS